MRTKFWVIVRDMPQTHVSKRHMTLRAAKEEAGRLCRQEQAQFCVMEVVAVVEPSEMPLIWYDGDSLRTEAESPCRPVEPMV